MKRATAVSWLSILFFVLLWGASYINELIPKGNWANFPFFVSCIVFGVIIYLGVFYWLIEKKDK